MLKVLLFFWLVVNISFAQNINKAWELLQKKEYAEASDIFRELLAKKKNILECKYGMTLIYADSTYKGYNLQTAYKYIKVIEKGYQKADSKQRNDLDKLDITESSITDLKKQIVSESYREIITTNKLQDFEAFLILYADETEFAQKATEKRDELAYQKAEKENTYSAYDQFVRKYPKAKQNKQAYRKFEAMSTEFYNQFSWDGELVTLLELETRYPYFHYSDTIRSQDKRIARQAEALYLERSINKGVRDSIDLILKVEAYQEYIKKAAPKELAFIALQRLMEPYIENKDWKTALKILRDNKEYFLPGLEKKILKLEEILTNTETPFNIVSIGDKVNSEDHEYAAIMSGNSKVLYFCGKQRKDNIGGEDIFYSLWENESWSTPQLIKGINTPIGNEAPLAISIDGIRMLLFSNSDIFYSDKKADGSWSPIQLFPRINTNDWDADAMLTADGKAVIFVSDRKGNVGFYRKFNEYYHGSLNGNTDIWISTMNDDGEWNEVVNLGKMINTPFCERSPFLHPDMKTLFFTSDGWGGLGRMDIYKTTRMYDTSWVYWTEPENLGRQINTAGDDWGYKITTEGDKAYFSGRREKSFDVLQFPLPNHLKPEMVAKISGVLLDRNKLPIKAIIKWEDLQTGKIVGITESDPVDGSFFIALPIGKRYGFFVEKDKYFPMSGNINLLNKEAKVEINHNVTMITLEELQYESLSIPLNNVFFDNDKYDIRPESFTELNRMAQIIINHKFTCEISGHTDNVGSAAHNQELSENRAESLKKYLITLGCPSELLTSKGYGMTKPISTNDTDEGKQMNRRVEIKIVK